MKSLAELAREHASDAMPEGLRVEPGRSGAPTATLEGVYLHSRYAPQREAARLFEDANLSRDRPVLLFGLGLGYLAEILVQSGFEVRCIEPLPALAPHALAQHPGLGDIPCTTMPLDESDQDLRQFVAKIPQLVIQPALGRVLPEQVASLQEFLAKFGLAAQRLNVAVVGPMYGGSEPIAGYLTRAFQQLGHNAILVDNSAAWPLYQTITASVESKRASGQLGGLLANVLAEWSYARVAEFDPEICIVLAQAPVRAQFAERLARRGTLTAFWFVENWRHLHYWAEIAPHYDYFFHIQPGEFEEKLAAIGCKYQAFVQTGCDPDLHRPVALTEEERSRYGCDISFAGAGYFNRLQFFRGLTDYDFKIWGVDWGDRELARRVVGGEQRFDNETFMKIVAGSRVNLNLHSSTTFDGVDPHCDAINPRVFEIAAAGGFQVCDPCIGLDRFFDTELLPRYRDLQSCRQLLDHFLMAEDERRHIAEAARTHVLAKHTYAHRAKEMLDLLLSAHGARVLKRGVRVQRTVGEILEKLPPDSPLAAWLKQLPQDLPFLQQALQPCVAREPSGRSAAEKTFCYMHEVREFAEQLLREQR